MAQKQNKLLKGLQQVFAPQLTPTVNTATALSSVLRPKTTPTVGPQSMVGGQSIAPQKATTSVAPTTTVRPTSVTPVARATTPVQPTAQPATSTPAPLNAVEAYRQMKTRPPTPAPVTVKEPTQPADASEIGIAKKLLKQQYGDAFTDAELELLAKKQIEKPKQDLTALEKAQQDYLAKLDTQTNEAQNRMRTEEERLRMQREENLRKFEEQLRAEAKADIEEAKRLGFETQTTEERLLGARGNITSTVGANRVRDIQTATSNTVTAVNARANAQLALKQAELEGADAEIIDSLNEQYTKALESENQAILQAETDLQNAKLQAQQAGDEGFLSLIQSSLDALSKEKTRAKADTALTKQINDGFVYDEFGQRVKDAEGNEISYDTVEELDSFMEVSPGASLYNPVTGEFIAQAPIKDKQTDAQSQQSVLDAAKNASAAYEELNSLISSPELIKVFGPRSSAVPAVLQANKPITESKLDRIKALLTTTELSRMKGLGAMSDREFQNLSAISTSLRLDLPEDAAMKEIQKIMSDLQPTKEFNDLVNSGFTIDEATEVIKEKYPDNSRFRNTTASFSQPAGTGSTTLKDGTKVNTPFGLGVATGVENGSKEWKPGLDLFLNGGKGATTKIPVGGKVIAVSRGYKNPGRTPLQREVGKSQNGGFGNQVKVQMEDGTEVWISHLDGIGNVKVGDIIKPNTIDIAQGNTGLTYGPTGAHLDITVKKPDGTFYTSQQVAQLFGVQPIA